MTFWSTEKFEARLEEDGIVSDGDPQRINQGCYELSVGPEACITDDEVKTERKQLEERGEVIVPPGQFGLLLTEETVTIPHDAIGFISFRFSIKAKGLINVSGFHVDPGFSGRLKFSVYNAGSQNIVLSRGDRVFMLWLASLDRTTTDVYKGNHQKQVDINSNDLEQMQGVVFSPAVLRERIEEVQKAHEVRITAIETKIAVFITIAASVLLLLLGIMVKTYVLAPSAASPTPDPAGAGSVPGEHATDTPQSPNERGLDSQTNNNPDSPNDETQKSKLDSSDNGTVEEQDKEQKTESE